jgi:hypothetical protein
MPFPDRSQESAMTQVLDLADIQGNIIRGYGREGFPKARFVFFQIANGRKGRAFVREVTEKVTTSEHWTETGEAGSVAKPKVTTNISFTFQGSRRSMSLVRPWPASPTSSSAG